MTPSEMRSTRLISSSVRPSADAMGDPAKDGARARSSRWTSAWI
jgi:hypothetical protein